MGCHKVFHITEESARIHAESLGKESGGVVPNVYFCQGCHAWHVGFDHALRAQMSATARRRYTDRRRRKGRRHR